MTCLHSSPAVIPWAYMAMILESKPPILETPMENDMLGRQLSECVISLLDKAKSRNKLFLIIEQICQDRPDLADPRWLIGSCRRTAGEP